MKICDRIGHRHRGENEKTRATLHRTQPPQIADARKHGILLGKRQTIHIKGKSSSVYIYIVTFFPPHTRTTRGVLQSIFSDGLDTDHS